MFVPTFKIMTSDNTTVVYQFPVVINSNHKEVGTTGNSKFVTVENGRSIGAIYIDGGAESEPIVLEGCIIGTDYSDLITKIDAMQSAIQFNTAYYLRVDKDINSYDSFKVKRMDKIELPNPEKMKMYRRQDFKIMLKNLAW